MTPEVEAIEFEDFRIVVVTTSGGCRKHENCGESAIKRHLINVCYFLKIAFLKWCPGMQCIPVTANGIN
jgi:hypothetical protein